jgi:hypothetical protein
MSEGKGREVIEMAVEKEDLRRVGDIYTSVELFEKKER